MRCRFRRQIGADYTDFFRGNPKGPKTARKPERGSRFQAGSERREARSRRRRATTRSSRRSTSFRISHTRAAMIAGKQRFTAAAAGDLRSKGRERCGSRPGPTPACAPLDDQKPQYGLGASSSPRKAPPTGAMITLTSCAGCPDSFRTMCPRPLSTKPWPADTTCPVQVGSSRS